MVVNIIYMKEIYDIYIITCELIIISLNCVLSIKHVDVMVIR